jgi:TRAP-type C4-dicarboxylate transport system substrate-binding protein
MNSSQNQAAVTVYALFFITLACLNLTAGPLQASTAIKTAVVMPEGSTWTKTLHEMADEVETLTHGEVRFTIYAGGVSGDEPDVIRKLRVNRIHAAGFSGIGLGIILPEVRILESVLLFRSQAEVDWVKEALFDYFAAQFERKGYVLLGFFEAGFTYIFSKESIKGVDGLKHLKMWIWKGDQIAEDYVKVLGIESFPLHVTDVNTGLETGMINAFYAPPLAAISLQWYARVSAMIDYPLVDSSGAFLINRRVFERLSTQDQEILRRSVKKYCAKLVNQTRNENAEAKNIIKDAGIQLIQPSADQIQFFQEGAKKAWRKNIPAVYSQALFDQVEKLLDAYRKEHP